MQISYNIRNIIIKRLFDKGLWHNILLRCSNLNMSHYSGIPISSMSVYIMLLWLKQIM